MDDTTTLGEAHDPVLGTRATRRPDPYAGKREVPQYEGHDVALADMTAVWAVGKTPREAIEAFCLARVGEPLEEIGAELESSPGDERWAWGYRFTCDGTGFKAAGILVPGGVVLTWWK